MTGDIPYCTVPVVLSYKSTPLDFFARNAEPCNKFMAPVLHPVRKSCDFIKTIDVLYTGVSHACRVKAAGNPN